MPDQDIDMLESVQAESLREVRKCDRVARLNQSYHRATVEAAWADEHPVDGETAPTTYGLGTAGTFWKNKAQTPLARFVVWTCWTRSTAKVVYSFRFLWTFEL